MKEKNIIFTARIMSMIFTPFYLPIVGLIALFIFSYMSLLPMMYKLVMLAMVYLLTVVAPSLLIHLYRLCQGWTSHELGRKERRLVPYIISIVCYFACFFWMEYRNTPRVISIIVVVALTIQMVCALINIWWKISTHTAAIGGVAGGLVSYSIAFSFNPLWWLCFVLILAGAVGTARMILRQHSLSQVVGGFLVGAACAILVI
ncbi:phosphatase PAP2 family protein [Prevotella copri]|jgi:membrane-associated phospholipid phosphatase|uniref:Phosphatase PAP2 family protein n=1 Tax=Segatella copri TaxID=165179 RepID=A0AA90ZKT5_9BACT|nr:MULTISPECIES: phosphatase PAP2 family protein [Prevotellaceae]MCP9535090.1 phosphatase PAP2 family protein [Segatella copri]MCP9537113.1 phosphatase PAP2 family protein [Segatella copri]MCP9540883.1 phosphatase PAP2 family protein [Segatella copri]MCP9558415.1 phosphatase PAP2 family protein [Segatella copri]MCP9561146.1 phosphatase PAP2 family protein [Segatella copri]